VPVEWDNGVERPVEIPELTVEPIPTDYQSVGFDAVSQEGEIGVAGFGHSPLSCNSMATQIPTNEFCLLPDLDAAVRAAKRFSRGEAEPGPYRVVEVLRPRSPSAS
jgi:hypothetical protein